MSEMPEKETPAPEIASVGDRSPAPLAESQEMRALQSSPLPAMRAVSQDSFPGESEEGRDGNLSSSETPLFASWSRPESFPVERIPHMGHLACLGIMGFVALAGVVLLSRSALHFHLFGVSTVEQALGDIRYTLGSQAGLYLLTLLGSLLFFPLVWNKPFFAGLQWNGGAALRLRRQLFGAAFICFVLAILNGVFMPGPDNTPIDRIFRTPGAAWTLFAFGVSFAPFFEEMFFRGFLLPALCTACDWIEERSSGRPVPPLDENGHPTWSMRAMAIGSILTSVPFAWMHAEQTGYAAGPFLLLIGVSLVLCWVRLGARSLAASVTVHASYNFMLFFLMLIGTNGFQHMDKM
jgi:membrane protease YdiL (CAAX protease family)